MEKHKRPLVGLFLSGLLPYNIKTLPWDLLGGVTLAAIAIPVDMGYAKIAGMPIVTGLYALFLPCIAFALFGGSRHLVVGADSASAAILAAGIAPLAAAGSAQYGGYAAILCLMVGVLLLLCRVFRLGFIANFLSRTVLTGFLTGVGVQVALGQVPELLGLDGVAGGPLAKLAQSVAGVAGASPATVGIAVLTLAVVMAPKLFYKRLPVLKRVPFALIAIIGGMALGALGLPGVSLVGGVQGGLPTLSLPPWAPAQAAALLGSAFSITLVIITQSAATASAFAEKNGEEERANRDLAGLAAANLAAGFSGAFVVNGSPTKTEAASASGAKSQAANLTAAAVVALVLLFFTGPLATLPNASLAALVFSTGLGLVDIKGLARIARLKKDEFFVALVTAITVVAVGAAQGIVLAMVLSLINHLRRGYHPASRVWQPQKTGDPWKPVAPGVFAAPGLVVYHFAASLYYANAPAMKADVQKILSAEPLPSRFAFDFSAIADVDYSGGEALEEIHALLGQKGVNMEVILIKPEVEEQLRRYGVLQKIGAENLYPDFKAVLEKVRR